MSASHHLPDTAFREHGRAILDWITDYWTRLDDLPVLSRITPGEVRAMLPPHPPARGEPFDGVLRDLDEIILPGITHWQSPSFFGFLPANVSGPAILGELVSAGLGVQGMMWITSPACTELETHVLDWLVEMLDLPRHFLSSTPGGGVIQDSASSASLCALVAARERISGGETNARGVDRPLRAYTSVAAHSSIEKAAGIAGIGRDNLRLLPTDESGALIPRELARAVETDRAAGAIPFFVTAIVGTTAGGGMDPLREIGAICEEHGVWLHVDAAMSGTAALCPEFRWIHDGLEAADSYCFNPHKWMFTNFDCDCFWVRDRAALVGALGILPDYLENKASATGEVIDYRNWQVPLGRRFRALKLWMVIRHYGVEGLRAHVREHVRLAQWFADQVRADERFELSHEPPLNLVCFRLRSGDEATRRLLDALNASGRIYLTHATIDGRYVMRMPVGGTRTEQRHVEAAWALIRDTASEQEDR